MTVVRCKDGVKFGGFSAGLARILVAVCEVAEEVLYPLTITAGSDGTHLPTSRHYTFEAVDLRTKHLAPEDKAKLQLRLLAVLGPQFSVLLEDEGGPQEHLHLQPRKGHIYRPS